MTHRDCIRLLALSILCAGCAESEPQSIDDKSEPSTSVVETEPNNSDKNSPQSASLTEKPITNSIGMKLQLLPAGTFVMGSEAVFEKSHQVTLTKPFYIGVHEVTQEQYAKVMGKNPSEFKGSQHPVETVSWADAVRFCETLSSLPKEKAAGRTYRLPTEAEWEFACRAGTTTEYSFGDDESQLGEFAWFDDNNEDSPQPVGQKKPNPWGLYDMHGNVYEWCQDWYGNYPSGAVSDPSGLSQGSLRVRRGGCWGSSAEGCRSSSRNGDYPPFRIYFLGFRVTAVPSSN